MTPLCPHLVPYCTFVYIMHVKIQPALNPFSTLQQYHTKNPTHFRTTSDPAGNIMTEPELLLNHYGTKNMLLLYYVTIEI